MISSLISQVCTQLGGIFTGPLASVGTLVGQVCGQIVTLLQSFGL